MENLVINNFSEFFDFLVDFYNSFIIVFEFLMDTLFTGTLRSLVVEPFTRSISNIVGNIPIVSDMLRVLLTGIFDIFRFLFFTNTIVGSGLSFLILGLPLLDVPIFYLFIYFSLALAIFSFIKNMLAP